jgi:Mrp family chromosome partitioning ATPase
MRTVVDELRAQNDVVIVQGPPLLSVADSASLAVLCDGVLLSVRYGRTHKEQLRRALATLERVGADTFGIVLNMVPANAEPAGAYAYGGSYDYDPATTVAAGAGGARSSHRARSGNLLSRVLSFRRGKPVDLR